MWLNCIFYIVLPCLWIEGGFGSRLAQEADAIATAPSCTKYSAVSCGVKNDKTRLNDVLNMDYVVPFLTALFVAGRIFARIRLDVGLGADDWMIVAASAAYFVDVGTSLGLVLNGFGQHTFWLSAEQVIAGKKFFYVVELFYMISITLTKLALLLFFLRIFPDHRLRQAIWISGVFVLLSNFSIFMALSFQCVPLRGFWTNWMYKVYPVKCINGYAALEAAAVFSILQSIMILVIPIPTVWRLNLPWKKKANLVIMFSVGSIALICSFMRLPSLIRLHHSNDLSCTRAQVNRTHSAKGSRSQVKKQSSAMNLVELDLDGKNIKEKEDRARDAHDGEDRAKF
ncbi:hypothetical protein BKA65DRAFT_586621 [Rhexocercosporidium sp. MPI-PUGE-AT-0058]|nr:hypothetical protein BKA65DRAFT_586621 [Rhexocercosporidium sp. MPI-PUGE-AT-0058]